MNKIILAIETSCDETSVAIIKGNELLANVVYSQIAEHQVNGGVMPELASRLHVEKITIVLEEALKAAKVNLPEIDAFAFTAGPGLIGCLHIGTLCAKTLALQYGKPLIPVNHIAGHIYANQIDDEIIFPALALVVSGGHTEIVYMRNHLDFNVIGMTLDDAVGEAYDKVARILNLPYPGGPVVDKLARQGNNIYNFPIPKVSGDYNFSFSGVKTAVLNLVNKLKMKLEPFSIDDICASFQATAVDILTNKIAKALEKYEVKQLLLAGGVAANSLLREKMKEISHNYKVEILIPPLKYCTDNAAMIASASRFLYDRKSFCKFDYKINPQLSL